MGVSMPSDLGTREDRRPTWSHRQQPTDIWTRSTMLVVDDDEAVRTSVAKILHTVGYTVIQAADGAKALRFLSTMRFGALVLDLKLPDLDGVSLFSAVVKPPPVVVLSAYELADESRRRFGGAFVVHLRKPVPPQRLLDAVAAATRRFRPIH